MFCPERIGIIEQFRTLFDFQAYRILFLLRLDCLQYRIAIQLLILIDCLCILGVCFGQINLCGHERTIFLNNASRFILITELEAFLIDKQGNLCANLIHVPFIHGKLCAAVTFPVYRRRALFPGKSVNMHLIRHHKCRIKAQSEMTDNLILVGLILILLDKVRRAGKSDLIDILLHLVCSHTQTVIHKCQCFLLRAYNHVHSCLVILRQGVFPHHIQLL